MFNALLAPLIFKSVLEYPLVLVLAAWLTPHEKDVRTNQPGVIEGSSAPGPISSCRCWSGP